MFTADYKIFSKIPILWINQFTWEYFTFIWD